MTHPTRLLPLSVLGVLALPAAAQTELLRFDSGGSGPQRMTLYGISMARVGDTDGDGVADFIIGGRPTVGGIRGAGGYRLVSGADGSILREEFATELALLGASCAGVGDVDGDGRADYVVGSPGFDTDRGRARLFSGATGAVLQTWTGPQRGMLVGRSVAGVVDLDGDALQDLAVAPANGGPVVVYSGRDRSPVRTFPLPQLAVTATAAAGDVDADGLGDLLIRDLFPGFLAGRVEVRSGLDGSLLHAFTGRTNRDLLGRSLSTAGDVDNDGCDDVILGANGRAVVYSGRTGALLFEFSAPVPDSEFGLAVCGAGDVDGDGHDDVAVGAPRENQSSGAVYVFSGADGRQLRVLRGRPFSDFGAVVAPGGDHDGDGFDDLLVSARTEPSAVTPGANGVVRLFSLGFRGNPGMVTRLGQGCVNRRGFEPRIGWRGAPVLGRRFEMSVQGAGIGAPGVLRVGVPADQPLDGLGAPGCRGLVGQAEFDHFTVTGPQGQAAVGGVLVPADARLLGVALRAQWVLADGANALGVSVSDALALRVGG